MREITQAINPELIALELKQIGVFKPTNKADNEIYIFNSKQAPNTLREIGRLREISFREAGGGSGKDCDLDKYDYMDDICKQLIVWNPERKEIIGGYRFIKGIDSRQKDNDELMLTSSHLFNYSDTFRNEYLDKTIELGRSFVRPEYQSALRGHKSLYALDNLWDGLGGIIQCNPEIQYFFGKATIYPSFGTAEFTMIQCFMNKYFKDTNSLIFPKEPMNLTDAKEISKIFVGTNFKEDYIILKRCLKEKGKNIPPLVNAYMTLSPSMKVFGAAINDEFGDVYETGLMIDINDIYEEKKARHLVNQYIIQNS